MTRFPETEAFVARMEQEGLHPRVIEAFVDLYQRYRAGDAGTLSWERVRPPAPADLVPHDGLGPELDGPGTAELGRLAVIALNGGLGTTMQLDRAKSLVPVRGGHSFLELTARQVLHLRREHGVQVPLLLMDSYRTRRDSLAALASLSVELPGLPLDFLQHKFPRIVERTALPARFADPEADWAPPGHGDIYRALWLTGVLELLLERGYRWAFVSNIDNLGGTVDPRVLGYLAREGLDFAMEVTTRTRADIKGGPLVRFDGRLMLLEGSQVEPQHLEDFRDLETFDVFNTNSLWWRLEAVLQRLQGGGVEMPMIVNPKTVEGERVVQLEQAMGAAICAFPRAVGIRVPRRRFAPVKATWDLLPVRSDAYDLLPDWSIRPSPARAAELGPPVVQLDPRHYQGIDDFEARFPDPPSMVACTSLTVEGDLRFGAGVRLEGDVVLRNRSTEQRAVPDGAVFRGGTHEI